MNKIILSLFAGAAALVLQATAAAAQGPDAGVIPPPATTPEATLLSPEGAVPTPFAAPAAPTAAAAPPVVAVPAAPAPSALQGLVAALDIEGGSLIEKDAAGVAAFYTARAFQPAWTMDGKFTATGRALIARLWAADTDGLNPAAYVIPDPALGVTGPATADAVATAELALSVAVAAYVREAYAGRLDPRSVAELLDISPHYPDAAAALTNIAAAAEPVTTLEGFNPPHEGYRQLRDQLAIVRATPAEERIVVPEGQTLRIGVVDDRVPVIRARLEVTADSADPNIYDEAVATAVTAFQNSAGLSADGILGPNTLMALNGPVIDPEPEIIANMERWRWLPRDLGRFHVMVNIPEFMLHISRDGEDVYETRVVVGLPTNQTPVFSDRIEYMMVNPTWNVPQSIIAAELLPQIQRDPAYFVRNGFDIFLRYDGQTYTVTPYEVNWSQVTPTQVSFRQRPGPANALGQIKFMFPNSHDVYLHDTPSKSLFARDQRAFSHGCVRVLNPMQFADALLMEDPNLDADDLEALFGDTETRVDMRTPVPVHLVYFTATVDDSGTLHIRNDIYGHSAAVRTALGI